ncbi:MAG: hypothetical protein IPL52_01115 [Flavobacteriales bacterium]|nr:hypothetical protein [Flavobacteriales bacterium]
MFAAALRRTWNDPLIRFLAIGAILYLAWYLVYDRLIHPWGVLDRALIDNLMLLSGAGLEALGYTLLPEPLVDFNRYIGVQGGSLLWIGDSCNGLALFAVFTVFMVAYPGPLVRKLWFIPMGLLSIHLLNVARIMVLCHVVTIDYELLNFNHDFLFNALVFAWIFGLWYVWMKRFARPAPSAQG